MRSRSLLPALLFLSLLAACYDPVPADQVLLVHASDPHLLDGKRPAQETLNQIAFARMMDTLRLSAADSNEYRYLAITGDLGIEGTDPAYEANPAPGAAARPDSAGARTRRGALAELLAGEIRGGPFRSVYFVPGNNDVFLEDANVASWRHVSMLVSEVQSRLGKDRRFVDLSACYHADSLPLDGCIARIDSPFVLVGFPSISFKNTNLDTAEYRRFIAGAVPNNPAAFDSAMAARIRMQDSLHLGMLRRLRQVLGRATAGGWRAIILTHIPDLDDPYAVGQRLGGGRPPRGLRLPTAPESDAWNAGPEVFQEWKAIVEWDRVTGVLAGHFHDSHRETYYRPYPWSRSVDRADRWKLFVTPPLSIKNQETSPFTARGFSVLKVRSDTVRRRLHWYERDPERFVPDDFDEPSKADSSAPKPAGGRTGPFDPGRSADHTAVFVVALLAGALAFALWRPAAPEPLPATSVG